MPTKDSFWINSIYKQTFDILVIGNGFTGMQVALQLKLTYPNQSIAIADQYYISKGASLRNAGFACFGSASEILDDIESSKNKQDVYDLVAMRYQGLQYLQEDFADFDYFQGNAHEVFLETETAQYNHCLAQLDEVNTNMKTITGLDQTYTTEKQHFNHSFQTHSIVNSLEGHLNTGKLYHQMQQKVIANGVFWIADFKVSSVTEKSPFHITSEKQEILKAHKVVSCINAFTPDIISNAPMSPARGQIMVTKPLQSNPLKGILHANKGYIYARDLGDRILIGGARDIDLKTEETYHCEENKKITSYLLDFVNHKLLKNEETTIDTTWSCIMGMSPDKGGKPIIKEEQPGFWSCYRLGGMGVALSSVLARKVAEQVI